MPGRCIQLVSTTTAKPEQEDPTELAACGCGAGMPTDRKAIGVDPSIKASNMKPLRRIEGQVRGLQKMVEDDRHCAHVMI